MKVKLTKKFLKEVEKRFGIWEKNGGEFTKYKCGHCKKMIKARKPKEEQCGSKGYWDSCKTCINCGGMNLVAVFPTGVTSVTKM